MLGEMAPPTTQPKRERPLFRLLSLLVDNAHRITLLLITASVLGLLALPLLDRSIRFEEKGLLAGMSHPNVGYSASADTAELLRISRSAGGAAFQRPGAAAALAAELRSAGLTDTQLSRPTVIAPGLEAGGPPSPCRCTNVHTRVRAPRGDGLESLALVTPLAFSPQRPDPAYDGRNQSAEAAELALMTAAGLVLHMARGHVAAGSETGSEFGSASDGRGGGRWLVRDLLWVVPDLSCGGYQCLEAWVRQYHGEVTAGTAVRQEANASASSLPPSSAGLGAAMVRGGVIQQAVVLEALAGASYDTSELLVVGHDGLLPKLDMFYLLRYLFNYPVAATLWRDELVDAPTQSLTAPLMGLLPEGLVEPQALRSYVRRLLTGLQFSWHQAVGQPGGPHAAFKDFMVDAATVRLTTKHRRSPDPTSASRYEQQQRQQHLQQRALSLSYCLELTLRSLNNLVERVHHSPFLYVLTDTDRFVSVERYVAPAVALTAALQLQAAWSMAVAQRALEAPMAPEAAAATTGAVAAALSSASQPRIWAAAAARAAARTAVLAVAAAALRALACGSPSCLQGGFGAAAAPGSSGAAVPPWVAAGAAALRRALALPLATPEGLLAVGAVLFAAGAAAVAAAGLAGLLAGAAASGEWSGTDDGKPAAAEPAAEERTPEAAAAERSAAAEARAVEAVRGGSAATPAAAGVQREVASGTDACRSDGEREHIGAVRESQAVCAAAGMWHAERVVVLTATAVAMTTLVCLNWAAALVAGMYLAPLALWQGWAAGRWAPPAQKACGRRGYGDGASTAGAGARVLRERLMYVLLWAMWIAWNPLVYLVLVCKGVAAVGFVRPMPMLHGTAAGAICALSATNYWCAGVVAASLWLFGGGSIRG
ncbi:Glycosylphosphatidylinositol anchor attachment 1 protein [Pleodorina starrii]|uniref:Glycosylphosphatidylinositol anchor attachment 1 protein n=1 Tax=Pleodorina starrii TaxID=330485 RepID=A0A9W6C0M3_9CHLO|nr:Glycosylphosphatidylinositol anchor attachment 1 protein [Pleodorina starrii]GLC61578.1 Glycosylphosphatidylinositol anchor attachment 1 protein [Pleodorina starrii]GLC76974.1 Glycosylphosphatidylinositol anchor attachment 1 protein [Pleodorina starrii]